MRSIYIIIVCLILVPAWAEASGTAWRTLATGLEYTTVTLDGASHTLHAFRIDLRYYPLDIALAADYQLTNASARELGERSQAVIAINGGFFSPEYKPLGLRIQHGKTRSPFKNTSWWGVFYVRGGKAYIESPRQYRSSSNTHMALQAGPRLVVNGDIPPLKGGTAARSAIGIDRAGRVIIAITQNATLTTTELAEIMRRPWSANGLNTRYALNLDGGRSAQLHAKLGNFRLNIPNISAVTDAIVVLKK